MVEMCGLVAMINCRIKFDFIADYTGHVCSMLTFYFFDIVGLLKSILWFAQTIVMFGS